MPWKSGTILQIKIVLNGETLSSPKEFLMMYIGKQDNSSPVYKIRLPRWLSSKESASQWRRHRRHGLELWIRKIPWRRKWQPTPVFLPGKLHGHRGLVGYRPWGRKKSDTTEPTEHAHIQRQNSEKTECPSTIDHIL